IVLPSTPAKSCRNSLFPVSSAEKSPECESASVTNQLMPLEKLFAWYQGVRDPVSKPELSSMFVAAAGVAAMNAAQASALTITFIGVPLVQAEIRANSQRPLTNG